MQEITVGECNHRPNGNKRNIIPIKMELCADSRKEECPYYVKIKIDTDEFSFEQGFCAYKFKKELNTNNKI